MASCYDDTAVGVAPAVPAVSQENTLSNVGAVTQNGVAADRSTPFEKPQPEAHTEPRVTVFVCSSCRAPDGSDARPRPGEKLAEAARLANNSDDVHIEMVECLGNCDRRLSATLVTPGCWTYVFGDLTLDNAADLVDGALLMRDSQNGLMPWRGRPQCMKKGMVARIPPLVSASKEKPSNRTE